MLLGLSLVWTAYRLFMARHIVLSLGFALFLIALFPPVLWALVAYGLYIRYIKPLI